MRLFNFLKNVFTPKKQKSSAKKRKRRIVKKIRKKIIKKAYRRIKKKQHKVTKIKKSHRKPQTLLQKSKEKEIGVITHYFGKISVGIIKLKSPLAVGEHIHIKGTHDDFTQTVSSMQYNHKDITYAKKGFEIGIKVIKDVRENDIVYKI